MYDYERRDNKTFKVNEKIHIELIFSFVEFETKKNRGFGFITFKEANAVEKVLAKDVHLLDEKQVSRTSALFFFPSKHQFDNVLSLVTFSSEDQFEVLYSRNKIRLC